MLIPLAFPYHPGEMTSEHQNAAKAHYKTLSMEDWQMLTKLTDETLLTLL